MKRSVKLWGVSLLLLIIAGAMTFLYQHSRPQADHSTKAITVTVMHTDRPQRDITLETDAAYLWDAMYAEGLIDGSDSTYGKWIETVDGETADEAAQQWWVFTQDDQWVETACDATPIADGEHYVFSFYAG